MEKPECYFVFNRTKGGTPTRSHPSWKEAEQEALRLASANPGDEFVVLIPATSVRVDLAPPTVKLWVQ